MQTEVTPVVEQAHIMRDGVAITFSDGSVFFFSASFLLASREHGETLPLLPVEDGY